MKGKKGEILIINTANYKRLYALANCTTCYVTLT